MGWLRRLCGGLVAEAMWWVGCGGYVVGGWVVRNTGNKTQLRLAGAGALPELGNILCSKFEKNSDLFNLT